MLYPKHDPDVAFPLRLVVESQWHKELARFLEWPGSNQGQIIFLLAKYHNALIQLTLVHILLTYQYHALT